MPNPILALVLTALSSVVFAASPTAGGGSVESRVAAQNALFEEYYQADLKTHPQRATSYGDYRYNDQLDQISLAAIKELHAADESYLARLQAIGTGGFSGQDL